MELYHSNYVKVDKPRVLKGKYTKDFGAGFYCTQLRQQAERWAGKFDTALINVYEYKLKEDMLVLDFKEMTDDWLDFVVACRAGKPHGYDIVTDAMADDQIYNYVADFIRGVINREQFWALAKFKYPTHQIAFCTETALECLTFNSVYSL